MWRSCTPSTLPLIAASFFSAATALQAEIVTFSVDPARSILSTDAILAALGDAPLIAQDAPANTSLTTSYMGTIELDLDDPLNPFVAQFLSANVLGLPSGEWRPTIGGGTVGDEGVDGDAEPGLPADAQYGYLLDVENTATGYFALRDTAFTIVSDYFVVEDGQYFPQFTMEVVQGTYEYNLSSMIPDVGDVAGSDDVTGEAADVFGGDGTYVVENDLATLTVPIETTFGEGDDIEVTFSGMLVATAFFGEGTGIPGDYNSSGLVEQGDLDLVLANWGSSADPPPANWINDLPSGFIDQEELDGVLANWGSQGGSLARAESVPEPSTLILLLLAPTPLIARLRW